MLSQFTSIDKIRYNPQGQVPVILQDAWEGAVMGLIWMDSAAVQHTVESGQLSGQMVRGFRYDEASQALMIQLEPNETGTDSEPLVKSFPSVLSELFAVICDRRDHPQEESYTCKLLAGGDNKILKKIGEESAEVVMACKDDEKDAIAAEVADLFYHTLVALAYHHVNLRDVYQKLAQRRR